MNRDEEKRRQNPFLADGVNRNAANNGVTELFHGARGHGFAAEQANVREELYAYGGRRCRRYNWLGHRGGDRRSHRFGSPCYRDCHRRYDRRLFRQRYRQLDRFIHYAYPDFCTER